MASVTIGDDILATLTADIEEIVLGKIPETKTSREVLCPEGSKLFSDLWGWIPHFGDFPVRMYNEPDAPKLDEDYIWPKEQTEELVSCIEAAENTRTIGWPSTGKTEWYKNFAAMTGRAFMWINYSKELFLEDILGCTRIIGGDTVFVEGDLPKAVRRPSVVLHDEVSAASSGLYMGLLQYHLINRGIKIQTTGQIIEAHEGMVLAGADNAVGLGDNSDKFPTRNQQDVSTLNRWSSTVQIDYLSEEDAACLIKKKVPELHEVQCKKLARFANLCQNGFIQGNVPLAFGPRQYLSIAAKAVRWQDMERAIKVNFLNALDEEGKAIVVKLMKQVWK